MHRSNSVAEIVYRHRKLFGFAALICLMFVAQQKAVTMMSETVDQKKTEIQEILEIQG